MLNQFDPIALRRRGWFRYKSANIPRRSHDVRAGPADQRKPAM